MKFDERFPTAALLAAAATVLAAQPARALDNPLTVNLRGATSHLQEAAATIFGSGSNVLVDVTRYRTVLNGEAVTLNSGTCARPGPIVFRLAPFKNYGSVTQLPSSISDIAARARSMVIHMTASDTSPTSACSRVVD